MMLEMFNGEADRAMLLALEMIALGVLRIDEHGRIWRHAIRNASGKWRGVERRRAENMGGGGYLRVTFRDPENGAIVQVMAHRLAWAFFNHEIPSGGLQVNHKDMDRTNNAPGNLELVTQSENILHRISVKAERMAA
jgi:hypothetical protein